ncbi:DNA phosphorothioation-associated putative methyltransferase [Tropicimonas marinistellae]|uniref:DNA phosphorothioation-associated putative methyltransferase n=1 Tax=Tropicimonas marinistellae TaxID=1739787 RepID=UPI00082CF13B|nr:DNA phosphorothioation-associated putative methyltransferase [Tropicimonas marinistellae]
MHVAVSGKQVAGSLYLHRDAIAALEPASRSEIWAAEALANTSQWNVVKLRHSGEKRISLLTYEDFERPFPALLESVTVNLENRTAVRRSYRARANPPVLHRKELLLPADHPRRGEYGELTQALESMGLLQETSSIGTRLSWEQRLREAGVKVVGHAIERLGEPASQPEVTIRRHLAAIRRDGLSSPVQALIRHGLIDEQTTLFDYGCGFGSDVEGLQAAGISAAGWDPYYAPDQPRKSADVVNLGFVLNVIETPAERQDVLQSAFALAQRCLSVAVITSSRARTETCRPYGDGHVTRLGTFQKFYRPAELKEIIETTLGREAFPAGPGLFFVFADPLAEQSYLLSRQTRRSTTSVTVAARRKAAREAAFEALRPDLEAIVAIAEDLGRWPAPEELPKEVRHGLEEAKTSIAKAIRLASSLSDPEVLEQAAKQRQEDISVYLALNEFNRRKNYRDLPERLQRDVRALFGNYTTAQASARDLLFSLADTDNLCFAAQTTFGEGLGFLDEEENYWICAELISRLPAALRCFAGCAEKYAGGFDEMHLVKFHLLTGKLTIFRYADFDLSPLPRLELRTKIDLRRQRISDFDHEDEDQRLVLKSRFMAPDQTGFERQKRFDAQASDIGLAELGVRATGSEILSVSEAAGRLPRGWNWSPITPR